MARMGEDRWAIDERIVYQGHWLMPQNLFKNNRAVIRNLFRLMSDARRTYYDWEARSALANDRVRILAGVICDGIGGTDGSEMG